MKHLFIFIALSWLFVGAGNSKEFDANPLEKKALDYYSIYNSILICEVSNIFYFQKVTNNFGSYHTYFIVVRVVKSIKGDLPAGSQIGCYMRNSDEKLELKGKFFMGFDGRLKHVLDLENDNLCPIMEILERNR